MTKIPKSIKALHIANILKRAMKWQIRAYEDSILNGSDDSFTSLSKTMKEVEEEKLTAVQWLIDFLKSEHKTNCKHPKKMHDTDPNGIVYCMKCGEDV